MPGEAPEPRLLPTLPPAQDHVVPLLSLLVETRDLLRRVLKVAVHDHDPAALALGEAGCDGRVLAEVPAQAEGLDGRIDPPELLEDRPGVVRAPIVHEYELIARG